jgi:hypothetical protein
MPDDTWSEERIAELRRMAVEEADAQRALDRAPYDYARAVAGLAHGRASDALHLALDSGEAVLSLLDALESTREALAEAIDTIHDLRLQVPQ